MSNATDLWTACVNAYSKYRGKGVLALMGRKGDLEIAYVHYDEVVPLVEKQPDVETACKALLQLFLDECEGEVAASEAALEDARNSLQEVKSLLSV